MNLRYDPPPRVFIGSSTERLEAAETIQELLDLYAETTVWSQGIFRPSRLILEELVRATHTYDFAVFVFAPDHIVSMRSTTAPSVRDNVIFELGLFMGALEPARCFIIAPLDGAELHLPTGLLGLIPLKCRFDRSDRNLKAALSPACLGIRRTIRERYHPMLESDKLDRPSKHAVGPNGDAARSLDDFVAEWGSPELRLARDVCRELPFDPYDEEFQQKRFFLKRIFLLLDKLADRILAGGIDEDNARKVFEHAVLSTWDVSHSLLAPPNHADEWWDPPPPLAQPAARWREAKRRDV